ncbi:hypothetical protein [Streptomyces luteocolor]|uniref:hypothetical protein n=1 Tax=Streptomyces luteocolor TaxID=285500 RepID=UPI00085295AC|nr:hypothetical protein [Streptomyces luteocolor]
MPPSHDPRTHGFLPSRPPAAQLSGAWTELDALAVAAAAAPAREEARLLVERAARGGEVALLRGRVARLPQHRAEAAAMRVAVVAAACGWTGLDPQAPLSRRAAHEDFLGLWTALAHRAEHQELVALPTLSLLNWAPERKPSRGTSVDQLARSETLVPIVRWAPPDQPLSRLDRLMLAAVRLEAHGIWLSRLAGTLAGRAPGDEAVGIALGRLTRVQRCLRGQLHQEERALALAPASAQQRGVLGALAERGALEPPVLLTADAVLGMGGRLGGGSRHQLRRHLSDRHRAWLAALDRHSAGVRTLTHRRGPDADAYREAQESLVALRRTYTQLVRTAMGAAPGPGVAPGRTAAPGTRPGAGARPGAPRPPHPRRAVPAPVGLAL